MKEIVINNHGKIVINIDDGGNAKIRIPSPNQKPQEEVDYILEQFKADEDFINVDK